jgi:hypothetical protein
MLFEYTVPPNLPAFNMGFPLVEITLYYAGHEIIVPALVDSGSDVSILSYEVGVALGLVWEEQTVPVSLGGILANVPAYAVLVRGEIAGLPEKALVCAWAQITSSKSRVILGQMNFFQHYKVTFEGYNNTFDISAKPL